MQTKSRELITKIKSLVSERQAKQLQRQVYINDRVIAADRTEFLLERGMDLGTSG